MEFVSPRTARISDGPFTYASEFEQERDRYFGNRPLLPSVRHPDLRVNDPGDLQDCGLPKPPL
jgi:hypothetical protein